MLVMKHTQSDLTLHERFGSLFVRHSEAPAGAKWAWGTLGGTVVAMAEQGSHETRFQKVMLQFHGGRQCWMVENCITSVAKIYPRDDYFGTLPKMMAKFEEITGHKLPTMKLSILGQGIFRVDSQGEKWDASNPWELVPGSIYKVVEPYSGREKLYEAVQARGLMAKECRVAVRFWCEDERGWSETFEPGLVFNGDAWERIRVVGAEIAQNCPVTIERQRG
jgi:hypothetical protein